VVEALKEFLTNPDKDKRQRGVELLSWLLVQLPKSFLQEAELTYFSGFYCDRLKDHHNLISSTLDGILALVKLSVLS